jgi:GTP-binding protein
LKTPFTIAIIGRPNTGKSTLFNVFTGHKKSIIDPLPGVTRDLVSTDLHIRGKPCRIVDTGGLFNDTNDELNKLVHARSVSALENAGLVIFLCDIHECLPIDHEIARLLHRTCKQKVILVLNKADNLRKKDYASETGDFHRFGFERIFLISAVHQLGISELEEFIASQITEKGTTKGNKEEIRICIVGKPNVGKSSLLNRLAGEEKSIVYDKPGTTRDPVDTLLTYHGKKMRIIDTAGMRKKGKVDEDVEYYSVNRAIKTLRNSEIAILMIDARDALTEQDRKIIELAQEAGRGLIVAINKWDLIDKKKQPPAEYLRNVRAAYPDLSFIPLLTLSALTGQRAREILDLVLEVHDSQFRRIETGTFNRFLRDLQKRNSIAPMLKIYYGMQVKTNPPVFQVFVNNKRHFPESRQRYLLNRIREEFKLKGVFPVLQPKSRKREKNE